MGSPNTALTRRNYQELRETRPGLKVVGGRPLRNKLDGEHRAREVLGEDDEYVVYTGRRGCTEGLEAVPVRGLAEILRLAVIVPDEIISGEGECLERGDVRQIKNVVELNADLPELSWQEVLDAQALSLGLARHLRDSAGPCETQVEHGEAVRRIEAPTAPSSAFAAARIEPRGLVPIRDRFESDAVEAPDHPWIKRGHVRP